jgi:hypothetical protein
MAAFAVGQNADTIIRDVQLPAANPVLPGWSANVVSCREKHVNPRRGGATIAAIREDFKRRSQCLGSVGIKLQSDAEYGRGATETAWHGVSFCYPILGKVRISGRAIL